MTRRRSKLARHPLTHEPLGATLTHKVTTRRRLQAALEQQPQLRPFRSLQELREAPDDSNLAIRLARAARTQPYTTRGEKVLRLIPGLTTDPLAAPTWVAKRLRAGISASTLAQDIAAARTAALTRDKATHDALHSQVLNDTLTAARRLGGPPPIIRGAIPMTQKDYCFLVARGDTTFRQTLALTWIRAARLADTLALRRGALWMKDPDHINIELGQEKTRKLGLPGYVTVFIPAMERDLLAPLISKDPPVSALVTRARLLLDITYQDFRRKLMLYRPAGSLLTPHSVRKGAVKTMLEKGRTLAEIALITQHRTTSGLMAYVPFPDTQTASRMSLASRALSSRTT